MITASVSKIRCGLAEVENGTGGRSNRPSPQIPKRILGSSSPGELILHVSGPSFILLKLLPILTLGFLLRPLRSKKHRKEEKSSVSVPPRSFLGSNSIRGKR